MKPLLLELQAFGPYADRQTIDFEKLARNGVEAELTREVQEHFLSAQDAERVNRQEAEAFRHSSLFA